MPFAMYDSVSTGALPRIASTSHDAVAGYVGGSWPTYSEIVRLFPNHHHLSIAVNAGEDAECLDIETGDATPVQAPDWVRRQHGRGIRRPVLYANRSTMPAVHAALQSAGIPRTAVRLWVADYIFVRPASLDGYDAWQWTDHALGRNLDESLCADDFFDTVPAHAEPVKPPKPKRHPIKRIVHRVSPKKPKPIHPKVTGATLGALVAGIVTAALNKAGVHLSPDLTKIITAVVVLAAGYVAPGQKSTIPPV